MFKTDKSYFYLIRADGAAAAPFPVQQDGEPVQLPRRFLDSIAMTIDGLGWRRYEDAVAANFAAVAANSVVSTAVPAATLRFVVAANVQVNDPLVAHTVWIEHRVSASSIDVAVSRPLLVPAAGAGNAVPRVGMERVLVMSPGDALIGRCTPDAGAGIQLILRLRSIDLPIGEYIPAL